MQIRQAIVVLALLLSGPRVPWLAGAEASFRFERIGPAPFFHPAITNVQIADLDGDKANEIIVCDAQRDAVFAYRRGADGVWQEQLLGDQLIGPAHATVVDLDRDGDADVIVSVMGNLYPDDDVIGSLVLLENDGGKYVRKTLLSDVRRVVDAQPGDFDKDGDIDLAVAVFGYLRGQVLWLENRGGNFLDHELLSAPGTIHVPVADYDQDGDLDIAAVVSQEEEEVWGFENTGGGKFTPRRLWMTLNFDIGSAGLVANDLDQDGDVDLLLPVGDNLEDSYSTPQPYHGCFWLENKGGWKFDAQRIATFPGTYAVATGDLDGDARPDVVLCSMVNDWKAGAPSLIWLHNGGGGKFIRHEIANKPIMLVTAACGDIDGDKKTDVVAGSLHMYPPYQELGRVSAWLSSSAAGADAPAKVPENEKAADEQANANAVPPELDRLDPLTRRDLEDLFRQLDVKRRGGAAGVDDWLELGRAYYAYGFFSAAHECFEKAAFAAPELFMPRFLSAVALARVGELKPAIAQFQAALPSADSRQKHWVQYEIGRCNLRLENGPEAEQAFIAAGDYWPALAQLAKIYIRSGRARQAVAPLNAVARAQPGTTELFLLNRRAAAQFQDAKMIETFTDRAEYNSRRFQPDYVVTISDEARKKYGAALRVETARKFVQGKQWEQAIPILREVVDATSAPDATILLAGCQLEAGRPKESIQLLEDLIKRRGSMTTAMLLLGDAYAAAGQSQQAIDIWRILETVRSGPALNQRLAAQYEKTGQAAAAQKQRALELQSEGIGLLRQANPVRAKQSLEAATRLDETLRSAWFYLGECYRVTGDKQGAKRAYSKAHELAPNHGRAASKLALLEEEGGSP